MSWVKKLQAAIDHIEQNLLSDLTPESVGRAIHYAPSSFQNLFSAVTGYSLGEYIRFRRLTLASADLARGETVTETAFRYGYETTEAFSKAFKRLFGCPPSRYAHESAPRPRFLPIKIGLTIEGGFGMARNFIPNLARVDWSDTRRQNEFVHSVTSALNALGERLTYDAVCALSGSAFRTSFSMPETIPWNHGNYHVINAPIIVDHTFQMLGYELTRRPLGDREADKRLVMDSIDRGVPVLTLEGVVNCADACVISGYDNDGDTLLGHSPFADIADDHDEAPDATGCFRKSNWHECPGELLLIGPKSEKPPEKAAFQQTLVLIKRLIHEPTLVPGQHNGLAAHDAFVRALRTYEWSDNFEPYLNAMCNFKQYLDRQYAVPFLRANGRDDLAACYEEIARLAARMAELVPQDFTAADLFSGKNNLTPYCEAIEQIRTIEERAATLLDPIA